LFGTSLPVGAQKSYSKAIEKVRGSIGQVTLVLWPPYDLSKIPDQYSAFRAGDGILIVGTALLINDSGDFLTAAHVVQDAKKVSDRLAQLGIRAELMISQVGSNVDTDSVTVRRRTVGFTARIVGVYPQFDVAVVHAAINPEQVTTSVGGVRDSEAHKPLRFSIKKPPSGEQVFACGFPMGSGDLIATAGHIASSDGFEPLITAQQNGFNSPVDVYKVDLRISPGNSGGPLFRESDQAVIGIIVEVMTNGGYATAVPAKEISTVLTNNNIKWTGVNEK
jgi:S1-C subfamily serine protease